MTAQPAEPRDISAAFFFPYLSLAENVVIRDWGLGGLSVGKPEWRASPVGEWVAAFIAKLRGPNGEAEIPATIAVARPRDDSESGVSLMNRLNALATAVQFSAILTNCTDSAVRWKAEQLVTVENGELRAVEVNTETRVVAWQEGFIRRRTMTVQLDDPKAVFAAAALNSIPTIALDPAVLAAVYDVHLRVITDPEDTRADQVAGALHWYLEAWGNSRNALLRDRIFYLKTGLDALAGTDKTKDAIPILRGYYERAASNRSNLLWTTSPEEYIRVDSRENTYSQPAFDHWYWALSDQRNALIHESHEPAWEHQEPDSIYQGGYFETAERVLRELILLALDELTNEER